MTRAWFIDFAASLILGVLTVVGVIALGGPNWAAFGFAVVVYLTRPMRRQEAERSLHTNPTVASQAASG